MQTVLDSVQLIADGRAPREPQDERLATYDPLLGDGHATIDWSRPQAKVHNLIRGCDPQPGAHTTWRGARLRLFEPRRVDAAEAPPGTVVAVEEQGLVVAAAGGAVRCARARGDGAKAAAAEVAGALGLARGDRLGAGRRRRGRDNVICKTNGQCASQMFRHGRRQALSMIWLSAIPVGSKRMVVHRRTHLGQSFKELRRRRFSMANEARQPPLP